MVGQFSMPIDKQLSPITKEIVSALEDQVCKQESEKAQNQMKAEQAAAEKEEKHKAELEQQQSKLQQQQIELQQQQAAEKLILDEELKKKQIEQDELREKQAIEEAENRKERAINSMPSGYIPSLNANVLSVQFFGSESNSTTPNQRIYNTTFEQKQNIYIGWQLNLKHPSHERVAYFDINAIWYRQNGEVIANNTINSYIEGPWINSYHNSIIDFSSFYNSN